MAILSEPSTSHPGSVVAAGSVEMSESVQRVSERAVRWGIYSSVALVPLLIASPDVMFGYADVPKIAAARVLAGFVAISAITNIAASLWRTGSVGFSLERAHWLIAAIALFLAANIASTALSISPSGSLNGAYPGFDGTDLYSLLSYSAIGVAAAIFLKTRRDFMSLLMAIAVAGSAASLYGAIQHFGFDPLGFDRFEVNSERTSLTFGNPGFAGSFLTISLFATAGVFLTGIRSSAKLNSALIVMFSLQAFALGTAASRGSWVGVAVGAIVFAGLAVSMKQRSSIGPRLIVLAVPFAVSVVMLTALSSGEEADLPAERIQSFNTELVSGGLNGRLTTWRASVDLIVDRPWLGDGSSGDLLRSLFGYGPDTFRYAYQQVAPDEHVSRFVPHAHNSVLNTAVEIGLVGLVSWLALSALIVGIAAWMALNRNNVFWVRVAASTMAAAYVAHFVDQLANVPRSSDSIAMWAITGAVIALWTFVLRSESAVTGENDSEDQENPKLAAIGPALAIPLIAVIVVVTVVANVGHVRADFAAASLQNRMLDGAIISDLAFDADSASALAPDVPYYRTLEAMALESAVAAVSPESPIRGQMATQALSAREKAASSGILPGEQFALARAFYSSGVSQPSQMIEAVSAYERLIGLTPNYWAAWLEMAAAYGQVGQYEEGVKALKTASEQLRKQPAATREDPVTNSNFDAVHRILGIEPGTHFP